MLNVFIEDFHQKVFVFVFIFIWDFLLVKILKTDLSWQTKDELTVAICISFWGRIKTPREYVTSREYMTSTECMTSPVC
jgi:hypothetical protein